MLIVVTRTNYIKRIHNSSNSNSRHNKQIHTNNNNSIDSHNNDNNNNNNSSKHSNIGRTAAAGSRPSAGRTSWRRSPGHHVAFN